MDEVFRRSMYENLRESFPGLFVNPPGAAYEILTDPGSVAEAEASYTGKLSSMGLPPFMGETGVVYADPYGMILRDAVRVPGGGFGTYIRFVPSGNAHGVVILPRYGDDVILVRHFRHATRDWQLELPRGFGLPGADPGDDARRELLEEIGAEAGALHDLGLIHADTGMSGTPVTLFYAEITRPPIAAGTDEGIVAVEAVSPAGLAALIRDEKITDSFTLAAYTRAVLRGLLPAYAS